MASSVLSKDYQDRLSVLSQIYDLYDHFISTHDLACQKGCAVCCTANVTLTTLEGRKIITYLVENHQISLLQKIIQNRSKSRFQPGNTINLIADSLKSGQSVKAEESDPAAGVCPLLDDGICPVYAVRPFGCRCLVSARDCRKQGWADIDDFILTVNNLFLQVIEHVDSNGHYGNLSDVLPILKTSRNFQDDPKITSDALVANHPMTVVMVPPEHRKKIEPLLARLRALKP